MNPHRPKIVSTSYCIQENFLSHHGLCGLHDLVPGEFNIFPLIHSALTILSFDPFNSINYIPVSGPLHLLYLLPRIVFP